MHPVETDASGVRPRLWRSQRNRAIAGVLGGLAEKFKVDPTFVRVLYAVLTLFSGVFPGVVLYLLLWGITNKHAPPPA